MLPLFIVDDLPTSGEVEIRGDEAQHIATSLRTQVGERLLLTNGRGLRVEIETIELSKKVVRGRIIATTQEEPRAIRLTVIQALTKSDRARESIELLTEGGVDRIIPWSASRSIGQWKSDAREKWQVWAREATKQSRRSWLPVIEECCDTSTIINLLQRSPDSSAIALVLDESAPNSLSTQLKDFGGGEVIAIIGPEGGITEDELSRFEGAGAYRISIGKTVFRSAHAGIAALAAIQTRLGLW